MISFKVTVKFIAVAAIFFVSGITIDGNELRGALGQVRSPMQFEWYVLSVCILKVNW